MRIRWFEAVILLLILVFAAYTRLSALSDNPGWYTDEGTHLDIARHLRAGEMQYMAINQSTLLVARFPLFPALVALAMGVFGETITAARVVSGSMGVLAVLLLYVAVWRGTRQPWLALLAAFCLAVYPSAIIYSRFAFSYNILAPLGILLLWGGWEYLNTARRGWLALAAGAIGIGLISDLLMANFLLPLIIIALLRRPHDVLWSVPLALIPFGLYALIHLLTVPQAFLFDLAFTLSRLGQIELPMQIIAIPLNLLSIFTLDYWTLPGLAGLFLLSAGRLRRLALLLLLFVLIMLARTISISSISFFYLIPLLPLFALGMAGLLYRGIPHVFHVVREAFEILAARLDGLPKTPLIRWARARLITVGTALTLFALFLAPALVIVSQNILLIEAGFFTKVDSILIDPDDGRAVAAYIDQHASPDDVVIVSPGLGWALRAVRTADFQMAVAYNQINTAHLPDNIPLDRFAFDPRYTQARYVIVDNLWRRWAMPNMPQVDDLVADVEAHWQPVLTQGEIIVYENPNAS